MITVHEVLTAINEVRQITCPPKVGETKTMGIDQLVEADGKLLALQERLIADFGNAAQSATL